MQPQIAAAVNSAIITVKVTVMEPPCTINDNRPIEVEFGDVMTTRVGGDNYRKQVSYSLSCSSNMLKMQIQGAPAAFDSTILHTNKTGLGIKLQQGNNTLVINKWLNFTNQNKPELWAVPVKQNGVSLTGGDFTAGAMMKIEYQ